MTVTREVRDLGGVARVCDLLDRGVARHHLRRALAAGEVVRPRRGWIATPTADAHLVRAARAGGRLSCVTQAERFGLWVVRERRIHLAISPNGSTESDSSQAMTRHWSKPLVAVPPGQLWDPIENVLALVASCQPFERALTIWESALRAGMVDLRSLARLPFGPAGRRVRASASPYADSGLETLARQRLSWLEVSIVPQAWLHGRRVDLLIDGWLVLQLDGGHHVGPQRTADIAHDAELLLRGYQVVRCSCEQVVHRWHEVQRVVQQALARGRRAAPRRSPGVPRRSAGVA